MFFGDTLVLAINAGVFQKLAIRYHSLELVRGVEVVVTSMLLRGAARAIGGGDDKVKGESPLLHALHHRILASAGEARDYDEEGRFHAVESIGSCG